MQRRGRRLASLVVASCLVFAACSDDTTHTEAVVAEALNHFALGFPRSVAGASIARVPDGVDIDAVTAALDVPLVLTMAPVELGPFWDVLRVTERSDYWQVDMASVDGTEYFSGSLSFVVGTDGGATNVEASEVGATPTTSVS